MNNKNPNKMSRKQFEKSIAGEWKTVKVSGKTYRVNGKIWTYTRDGNKYAQVESSQVMALTWKGLHKLLVG